MIKDEVEPMAASPGDAFVSPALLGGQALTALAFIIIQNLARDDGRGNRRCPGGRDPTHEKAAA